MVRFVESQAVFWPGFPEPQKSHAALLFECFTEVFLPNENGIILDFIKVCYEE